MTERRALGGSRPNGKDTGRKKRGATRAAPRSGANTQIVVLGMHRSGTSALTGALAAMGIYVGGEEELTPKSWENPAGFFERRDARKICDTLLHRSNADWWKVGGFHSDNVNHEAVRAQRPAIRELVGRLDEHGTWALKEPRLCLLLPIFLSTLGNPLAVITLRHPVEIARSLRRRNGFPVQAGLALWEAYTVSLLRNVRELDHVFVDFHELTRDPRSALGDLRSELSSRGIRGLDLQSAVQSVQPSLRRERVDEGSDDELLSAAQAGLWAKLLGDRVWQAPPQLSAAAVSVLREFEADETSRQEARASTKNLMTKIAGLETAAGETKVAEQRWAAEAQQAAQKASELAAQVEKLKGDLETRDSAVASLTERLASEGRRIEQLAMDLSARGSEVAVVRTALNEMQRDRAEKTERLEVERRNANELRDAVSTRELRIATLQVQLSELERRYAEQRVEMEQAQDKLSALEAQSADRQVALGMLEVRYAERAERIAADAERTEELRRELSARDLRIVELQTDLRELHRRHVEQVERASAEQGRVEQLHGELSSRDRQIEALRAEIGKLERGYRQQSDALDQERTVATSLRDDLESRDARLEGEALRIEALLAEVASRDAEISELRAARGAAENDSSKLKAELSALSSQLSELDYRHTKQSERLDDVIQRFKAERKKRRALNAKLDRQLSRAATQQASIDSLTAAKDAAESQLAALESSRSWQLVSAVSRFGKRLSARSRASGSVEQRRREAEAPTLVEDQRRSEAEQAPAPVTDAIVSLADSAVAVRLPPPSTATEAPASKVEARAQPRPSGKLPLTALVITWDIGHNPLGRSYMLAEVLDRVVRHTVIAGFQFARYGKTVWEPLRKSRLPVIRIAGQDFPDFIDTVDHIASVVRPDVVIACKPRLPSLQLGLKIKEQCGCPLIVDIDDHELSFFKDQTPLTLEAVEAPTARAFRESAEPYGQLWTRLSESLLDAADARLVSNTALQHRYGGHLVPHVRDEGVFDRKKIPDRSKIRRDFGIPTEAKVVLFFGTPRQHKGIEALADAVGRIADPDFRLVVVGRASDRSVTAMLEQKAPGRVIQLPNQPFAAIPEVLACADVVALPQDVEHPVSLYQLPAKAIDAIAMGTPLLVSRTPPLMDLVRHGVATLIEQQDLSEEIEKTVRSGMSRERSEANRARFLETYSYAAAAAQLREIVKEAVRPGAQRLNKSVASRLANAERKIFGAPDRRAHGEGGNDVVLFWKQNDTTLYGRRHDMIIEYLASRPDTRRILVFDAPISIHTLMELRDQPGDRTQNRHVYVRTEEKLLGLRDRGKIRYRVFAYQPGKYHRGPVADGRPALSDAYMEFIRKTLQSEGIESAQSVFWFYPKNEFIPRIVETFKPLRTVVDVVDDHRAWPNVSPEEAQRLTKHYREALSLADFAFANCEPVCESMREFSPGIQLIPNGCDLDMNVTEPVDCPEFDRLKRWQGKTIGFVGNLETKIDVELLHRVAAEFPECLLVLAGSTHANPSVVELTRHPNVSMPGVVPYEHVGAWVKRFSVAIIPHRKSNLTTNMNPLKLFVYAAHQIPVVSTDIPNLDERLENLFVARSEHEFVDKIRAVVSGRFVSAGCPDYRLKNSWESRFKDAVDVILERRELRRPSSAVSSRRSA